MFLLYYWCLFLRRDAMHKRGLCRRAVAVCPSVTLVYSVETTKHIFKFFHRRVATRFWFSMLSVMTIFCRDPPPN